MTPQELALELPKVQYQELKKGQAYLFISTPEYEKEFGVHTASVSVYHKKTKNTLEFLDVYLFYGEDAKFWQLWRGDMPNYWEVYKVNKIKYPEYFL